MLMLLAACNVADLSQPTHVDRTRVLAVKSTPAEPTPGQAGRLRALAVDPVDGIQTVLYFGCLLEDSNSFGCTDLELLGQWEPGGANPSFNTPEDILDDLTEEEKVEGLNYLVQFQAVPNGVDLEAVFESEDADLSELGEAGFKRVPVSLNPNPNNNPSIEHLMVDGFQVDDGDTIVLTHGQTYDIDVVLSDDSLDAYTYTNSDGVTEDRVEEPYFTFHSTEGDIVNPWSLHPFSSFEYTAPVDPDSPEGTIWIVTRDRRGGQDWIEIQVRFD